VDAWDRQKHILDHPNDNDDLTLGFATFFLNRTNRSGILNGGIIGGRDQTGPWKIDARYNSSQLIFRIESIAKHRSRISLSGDDAIEFLKARLKTFPAQTLIYLDPPYYGKGKDLYFDYYGHDDHAKIAKYVTEKITRQKWIVSYDNVDVIRRLYRGHTNIIYELGYSARDARIGSEALFFCNNLTISRPIEEIKVRRVSILNKAVRNT
jgi:DNA adenine methylase